jgi:hypothetical protein
MDELHECIDGMKSMVQDVMAKHEMDFLTSYKSHMFHVKNELDKYKKELNEKEFMSRRENRMVKL